MGKVKDMPNLERPREKLERYGKEKLTDYELLAIVLGSGIKGVNVIQLAKKIVKKVSKVGLEDTNLDDLIEIKGLGKAKAMQVISALEFGRRQFVKIPQVIITPKKVFELCEDIRKSRKEHFVVFYLDSRNVLIKREVISIGTLNASLVHPREVFEPAIRYGSYSIIVAHNHPSGDCEISSEDYEVTSRLKEAGKLLGISLKDHIIVVADTWKSLRSCKLL